MYEILIRLHDYPPYSSLGRADLAYQTNPTLNNHNIVKAPSLPPSFKFISRKDKLHNARGFDDMCSGKRLPGGAQPFFFGMLASQPPNVL